MLVARSPQSITGWLIVAGPAALALGLAGVAGSLAAASLLGMAAALVVIGLGFGVSHGFISQRTIAHAEKSEEDVTSGGIPTIEGLGSAVGAALAGIIASAAGFPSMEAGLRPFVVTTIAGAVMALLSVLLAVKFVAAGPLPRGQTAAR
jgi:hypothetical protein